MEKIPAGGLTAVLADEEGNDGKLVDSAPACVGSGGVASAQQREYLTGDKAGARVDARQNLEDVVLIRGSVRAVARVEGLARFETDDVEDLEQIEGFAPRFADAGFEC